MKWMITLLAGLVCTTSSIGLATGIQLKQHGIQISAQRHNAMIELNFNDGIPLIDLIKTLAQVSGKNVMVSKNVKSVPVPIFASGTYSNEDAYELILTALETIDLGIESHGRYIRVVPRDDLLLTPKR